MARNYRKEYDNYQGKPEQIKRRARRVKARRMLEREGKVHHEDGKDVHHKNGNPTDDRKSNLAVRSRHDNRSYPRNKKAGKR